MEILPLVDMKLMYIFSELQNTSVGKHIILPIMNFDIEYSELNKLNSVIGDKFNKGDMLYVQVLERYYKTYTLREYLDNYYDKFVEDDWKVLFFQVLATLAVIQQKYNSFRHNRLNLDSIFVYEKQKNGKSSIYKILDNEYVVPNRGFDIKISDFHESSIKNIASNKNAKKKENPYYDVHYFFQSLLYYIEGIEKKDNILKSIREFYNIVLPKKFRYENGKKFDGLDEYYYLKNVDSIITPIKIISKNNFFTDFISKMDISDSSVSNSPVNIESLRGLENSINFTDYNSPTESSASDYKPRMLGKKVNSSGVNDYELTATELEMYQEMVERGDRRNLSISEGGNISDSDSIATAVMSTLGKKEDFSPISESILSEQYQQPSQNGIFQQILQNVNNTRSVPQGNNPMGQNVINQLPKGYKGPIPEQYLNSMPPINSNGNNSFVNSQSFNNLPPQLPQEAMNLPMTEMDIPQNPMSMSQGNIPTQVAQMGNIPPQLSAQMGNIPPQLSAQMSNIPPQVAQQLPPSFSQNQQLPPSFSQNQQLPQFGGKKSYTEQEIKENIRKLFFFLKK